MSELKDLLLKRWGSDVSPEDVKKCSDEIKEVQIAYTNQLCAPDYKVGRCRVWVDEYYNIKFIVLEQANGKELRVDSEPPLDTSDWPKRARLHRIQDPWS